MCFCVCILFMDYYGTILRIFFFFSTLRIIPRLEVVHWYLRLTSPFSALSFLALASFSPSPPHLLCLHTHTLTHSHSLSTHLNIPLAIIKNRRSLYWFKSTTKTHTEEEKEREMVSIYIYVCGGVCVCVCHLINISSCLFPYCTGYVGVGLGLLIIILYNSIVLRKEKHPIPPFIFFQKIISENKQY